MFIKTIDDDFLDGHCVVGILEIVVKGAKWFNIIDVILSFPNIADRITLEGIAIDRVMGNEVVVPEGVFDGLARITAVFGITIDSQILST